jgi:galactosylceramidase
VGTAPELDNQTTVLNRLPHYPGTSDKPDSKGCTQYDWNTTDGARRARSHCRFVLPLIHFIPDSLTYSVPLFLKRQCDRTLGSRWTDEEGSIFDGRSARCLARCVNRGYVTGCHTATFQWHLISSFYDYLPWARDGVAVANEPWSGHYEITAPTWSLAHTTQFASPGWRMLSHDAGTSLLAGGGSVVTRLSPDKQDWCASL